MGTSLPVLALLPCFRLAMAMGSRSTWGVKAVIDQPDAESAKRVFRVASEKGSISLHEKKWMPKSGRCEDRALCMLWLSAEQSPSLWFSMGNAAICYRGCSVRYYVAL